MFQCHILSEYCVLTSSNTRFFKVIHLTICSHECIVRDHHRIQTQTTQGKWVITSLNKIRINKDISKIHYRNIYHIAQLNTIHVTSPLYHLNLFFHHQSHYTWITHSTQDVTTLTNCIINNSQVLCDNYTKNQSICNVVPCRWKTTPERLGVHNKTRHTIGMSGHSH